MPGPGARADRRCQERQLERVPDFGGGKALLNDGHPGAAAVFVVERDVDVSFEGGSSGVVNSDVKVRRRGRSMTVKRFAS
jgi:hypothetical protein